ncbi:MAG: hypothetical protein B6245_16050, partial [Desulfobacteraceae bacterium 4572_88]
MKTAFAGSCFHYAEKQDANRQQCYKYATIHADLFGLPAEEFDIYFRNDNMLDYLRERAEKLELGLAEAEELRQKLNVLRGQHSNLRGHYYEREVLLNLFQRIIDG